MIGCIRRGLISTIFAIKLRVGRFLLMITASGRRGRFSLLIGADIRSIIICCRLFIAFFRPFILGTCSIREYLVGFWLVSLFSVEVILFISIFCTVSIISCAFIFIFCLIFQFATIFCLINFAITIFEYYIWMHYLKAFAV